MKVSKSSWHYRLVGMFFWRPSESLCLYFWQVPLSIVLMALFALVPVIQFLVPVPAETVLASGVFGIYVLSYRLVDMVYTRKKMEALQNRLDRFNNEVVYKEPSLLSQWIRAKKDKVCPRIDFE